MHPINIFASAWWSIDLPEGWSGSQEEKCATFRATPSVGVLQISAARKEEALVTDGDLQEFALDQIPPGVRLNKAKYGFFSGFTVAYPKGNLFWREWWLRSDHLMLYATYNVVQGKEHIEVSQLEVILSSLRANDRRV